MTKRIFALPSDSLHACTRLSLATLLTLGTLACAPDHEPAELAEPDPPAESLPEPARRSLCLMDGLAGASIQSPLLGLPAAASLEELDDPRMDLLLEEGFEDFDWELEDWPRVSWGAVVPDERGQVLRLEGISRNAMLGWVLPVHTDSLYHFERSVSVQGEPFCDLYVVESVLEVEDTAMNGRSFFLAGRGAALKVHALPLQSGDRFGDGWQQGSTSFQPTPRTRSLVVLFRPRVGGDPGATQRSMRFDDVRLQEVLPTPEERIRLLKGSHASLEADPELGMLKSGLLLPLPSPGGVQEGEAAESNYDWRRAIYGPPTTELAFELDLPLGARLRLATGLARETPKRAAARFQVELVAAGIGETQVLLDQVRSASMQEWHWEDLDLDLSAWGGQSVTLTLRTQAEKGDPHPLWANPRVEQPNQVSDPIVILIAVDTLRADRLGSYGYERPTTPALDQLAEDGVRFDQARSNCNWTCPSFASIFTGMVPSRHGVSSYGPATPLPNEWLTLAEHFQGAGWSTRSIAYKVPLFDGNYEQGFDQAFNVPRDVIRGEENLARAMEWLHARPAGPAFLFLHFNDPHQPFVQPEPYDRAFGPAPEELGFTQPLSIPNGNQPEAQRVAADLYDGAVSYVDACIGQFFDAMRTEGLYEQATIAFVADHGEELWEHGGFGHGGDRLFDEVVRVPLIVKPPSGEAISAQVIKAEVSGFDVMPTLLDLAGIRTAKGLDALSLVPLMTGEIERFKRCVVTETSARGLGVVDSGFKYVLHPGGQREALYDLAQDPKELEEIASERPEETRRMRSLALAYLLEHRPGNYLLLRTGEQAASFSASTRSLHALLGPGLRLSPGEQAGETIIELPAQAWGLIEVDDANPEQLEITGIEVRGSDQEFQPWVADALPHLTGQGLWRVRGPESIRGASDDPTEPQADVVDEEMQEALRRLGYVE